MFPLALTVLLACVFAPVCWGQIYDLLLKGGHVIDVASGVDGVQDVAIVGGRIAQIAPRIPPSQARQVFDATGLYVTPGLVDLHFHSYGYEGAIFPDDTALLTGATTVVDAGGPGYRTFDDFLAKIVRKSQTRVLAWINIAGAGMVGPASEDNVDDMLPEKTAEVIRRHRDIIVGIKVAHFGKPGWDALKRAIEAGRLAGVPVMVDDKIFTNTGRTSREKLLDVMRPGDIHTHMYNDRQVEILDRFTGRVQDYALEARRRGVIFDLGHGAGSFLWPVALAAAKQGFFPDTISTDLHSSSILMQQSDMPNCISKMLLLGMSLREAIAKSTLAPAQLIRKYPEIGSLSTGAIADVAVLALRQGVFAFKDAWGKKMLGTQKLEAVATVRQGKLIFDLEARAFPEWTKAGDYEILP
ncbi:MAG: amidohydrolase/deacetylase family metallohydrolase [Bryobacteraceae bacterium]|nr:amidohydrolase/deacetylase family metallohydrolase [Bryobacteraceae bacterium]MDW8379881.1 amidohydrolase/deacetylase family metallohydrolase [Bryobacterales bacterium]